jgi:hypothetical protein
MFKKLKEPEGRKLLSEVQKKHGPPEDDEGSVKGLKGPVFKEVFLACRAMGNVGESQTKKSKQGS